MMKLLISLCLPPPSHWNLYFDEISIGLLLLIVFNLRLIVRFGYDQIACRFFLYTNLVKINSCVSNLAVEGTIISL